MAITRRFGIQSAGQVGAVMKGKTVVITGRTSGIGEISALELAGMGARIVLIARDAARGAATLRRLPDAGPGLAHVIHYADLSRWRK
jgi:dehydrogenase/reductase SDR family protein 12